MDRITFENKLFNAIKDFYEGMELPEYVLVAVGSDTENVEVLESEESALVLDWRCKVEKICTKDLSDSISEFASYFFDERM